MGNNPSGENSFQGFGSEPAYGEITKGDLLRRSVPTPPAAGANAPQRAQRAAVKGRRAAAKAKAAPAPALPPEQPTPPAFDLAMFWQALAAEPGASSLVRQIAMEAAGAA